MFLTNSESDAVQAVRQGLADVYVSDEVMLTAADQQRLGMRQAFRGDECFDVAFVIKKGNNELARQMNAFIASLPLDSITEHWIHGGPAVAEPPYVIKPGAKPLRCVCCVNLSPVCFMGDGSEWRGIDADVLRRFAHSQGRPFEMNFQEVSAGVIAIQTGLADVLSGFLFVTDERKKSMDFTMPYYRCHPGYFVADKSSSGAMSQIERWKMNLLTENRWRLITDGLVETIIITIFSILLGTALGAGVCACRRSKRKWLRKFADVYSDFINGIPTLVLLLIMFYVVLASSGLSATVVAIIGIFYGQYLRQCYFVSTHRSDGGRTESWLYTLEDVYRHCVPAGVAERSAAVYRRVRIAAEEYVDCRIYLHSRPDACQRPDPQPYVRCADPAADSYDTVLPAGVAAEQDTVVAGNQEAVSIIFVICYL